MQQKQNKLELGVQQENNNFNNFFDAINDMLFVLDTKGKIIQMNNTAYKRLEYTKDELTQKSVLALIAENARQEVCRNVSNMLLDKVKFYGVPLITKHKEIINVETRIVIGRWNNKPALFGVARDISDIKLSEVKFSEAFYCGAGLMTISSASDNCYIDVNKEFLTTLGFERDDVIGKKPTDLGIFVDSGQEEIVNNQLMINKSVHDLEVLIKGKNGLLHTAILTTVLITLANTSYWKTTMTNITQRKSESKALNISRSRLITAQLISQVGNWELTLDTKNMWASEEAFNIYGIDYVTGYLPLDVAHECVSLKYRELLTTTLKGLITKNEKYDLEYKIKDRKSVV
jgi:PAS domain S-box-containing protein